MSLVFRPGVGWVVIATAVGLSVVGVLAISTAKPDYFEYEGIESVGRVVLSGSDVSGGGGLGSVLSGQGKKQAVFLIVGLVAMMVCSLPHHRRIVWLGYPMLVVVLLMLVVVLLPFMPRWLVPVRGGARRWFDLGVVSFQPSELAKVAYVLSLACYLRYRENYRTLRGLLAPLLITFLPMVLIVVEPDLGTAMVFLPVFFAMLVAAGARIKHLLLMILIGLILVPMMYPLLEAHQKDRIQDVIARMIGDTRHEAGISYQGKKATMLTGAGGLFGCGNEDSQMLIGAHRLPEAHNDMIFVVICLRWGLIGGICVLLLFLLLLGGGLAAAGMNRDPFARLIAVGVVAIIFTQVFVNVGMTVGLLPITGMTLPFVSYGGSSLVVNFAMVGLLVNVAARRPIIMAEPSFEF